MKKLITDILHTTASISLIKGYIGVGDEDTDIKAPEYIHTLCAWVGSPEMVKIRMKGRFIDYELAAEYEFTDWRKLNDRNLSNMAKYVDCIEVEGFIDKVQNFINMTYLIQACRILN